MSELKVESYMTAMELNKMAIFEWNILADTLNFDDMMKFVT